MHAICHVGQGLADGGSHYGLRYYVPSIGRWISRDPIEENGASNLYCTVDNDPLNLVDIIGLSFTESWGNTFTKVTQARMDEETWKPNSIGLTLVTAEATAHCKCTSEDPRQYKVDEADFNLDVYRVLIVDGTSTIPKVDPHLKGRKKEAAEKVFADRMKAEEQKMEDTEKHERLHVKHWSEYYSGTIVPALTALKSMVFKTLKECNDEQKKVMNAIMAKTNREELWEP
jgi:RHS repeat-associated protein